jgi:hypothetical protein
MALDAVTGRHGLNELGSAAPVPLRRASALYRHILGHRVVRIEANFQVFELPMVVTSRSSAATPIRASEHLTTGRSAWEKRA